MHKFGVAVVLMAGASGAIASNPVHVHVVNKLHAASDQIVATHGDAAVAGANLESITEHLYARARPHVRPSDPQMPREEVDRITRDYLREKYVRVLLDNYVLLYQRMRSGGAEFAPCGKPLYFRVSTGFRATLCLAAAHKSGAEIKYITDASAGEPKHAATFVFARVGGEFQMTKIELALPGDTQFRIEGL